MGKLQLIETQLRSINDAVFQELCDCFLKLRHKDYKVFSRVGSMSGKVKTVKGTPDTLYMLNFNEYIFIEYSTNESKGAKKLVEDLLKCIDESVTGIPLSSIKEIIFCVNFNLKLHEIEHLYSILSGININLKIYTLNDLSIELYLHHRDLVHEYLGLSLDTGQIVSVETFIKEYNKAYNSIAAPLDNKFLHREQELKDLIELIYDNDFIIITGAPGVGKTKLALEAINNYIEDNKSYNAFCISYKNADLIDNLLLYLSQDKDYILFIDDANRIGHIKQIIGFYNINRSGKLKIIVTVRDYAQNMIIENCIGFSSRLYKLNKLSDEHIIDIIQEQPFNILNFLYHKDILRIADGNPRLAIMAATLVNRERNINVLRNTSDLFDLYFNTFAKDINVLSSSGYIAILGVIAFFHAIPYKDRQIVFPILDKFNIEYSKFVDTVDFLNRIEVVDIKFDYVKITEQNLSTYFFYKAFIKDNVLSFKTLLKEFYENYPNHFSDCLIPSINNFGYQILMPSVVPYLKEYWGQIKMKEYINLKFLSSFWFYLQNEVLEFIHNLILGFCNCEKICWIDDIIPLLSNLFTFPEFLRDSLELAFEYVKIYPANYSQLIKAIKDKLSFDIDDEYINYSRQSILYDVLLKGVKNDDILYDKSFYELSSHFLKCKFDHAKNVRNNSISLYQYPLPDNEYIRQFRKKIWDYIDANYNKRALYLLNEYIKDSLNVVDEIIRYDQPFIFSIIKKHLSPTSFDACRYVQAQVQWWKSNDIDTPDFSVLIDTYTNEMYQIYLTLSLDDYRDKQFYEFDSYEQYEEFKEAEVRRLFVFSNVLQFKAFYKNYIYLFSKENKNKIWSYRNTLDIIVDENLKNNFDIGCKLMELVVENNVTTYIPFIAFKNHLNSDEKTSRIWNLIQDKVSTSERALWEISFYEYISEDMSNSKYLTFIKDTIINLPNKFILYPLRLKKFLKVIPGLFNDICKLVIERNNNGDDLYIHASFFNGSLNKDIINIEILKNTYLQQSLIQENFDYNNELLKTILDRDINFLVDYTDSLYSNKSVTDIVKTNDNMSFVWRLSNVENVMHKVFDILVSHAELFHVSDEYGNSFFNHLTEDTEEWIRAKQFMLSYCRDNFGDMVKINYLIDIIKKSMNLLFEKVVLLFISLTQDVEMFSSIHWVSIGGVYSGNTIIGAIKAREWERLLSIINKSDIGIKLLPIKQYVNMRIQSAIEFAEEEKKNYFIGMW